MNQGPNVKKLIAHRMAMVAVPPGGGFSDALKFLTTPGKVRDTAKEATEWVEAALLVVRSAPDNPYQTDEEIAGAILAGIEKKKPHRRSEFDRHMCEDTGAHPDDWKLKRK